MFWVQFLIALAFTVVGELLRPKPKFDTPRPTSLGEYRAPTADEVRPIPVAYGTVKITGPNAVWWGDFEARPITKKVKTGLFSSDRITLGYQYWLGMQLALCWGSVDELIGLEFDEKPVTLFNRVNGTDVVSFGMDQPQLFSSDDPPNGVKGAVKFYRGTFTQNASQYLATQFGEFTIPAYRGICYAVFEKCYLSNNDSVPPVAWIVRRTPNTLGLTGGRENINGDANPACALFEVMTNTFWGAAVPQAAIDTNSFVAAANTLHAEGLGISMLIDTAGTADGIMGEILRHIDGVIFIDPETGKFTLKLARNDYVVASLPLLDPSSIAADSFKYTRGSWDETKNTVKIKYVDREQRYTDRVVQQQNLANITVRGGQVDADDFDFSGLSNPTAANVVAARVLKTVSSPLSRVECEVNRTQFGLRPGSVFRLSWPQLGISQVVYRVVEVDYGTLESGVMRIRAVEDVFSVAAVSFINPPGTGWQNPFGPVSPATRQSAFEVPYAMQATPSGDRYIATTASPARPSDIGYRVWQDASGGSTFTQGTTNTFTFTPNGTLTSPLAQNTASSGVTVIVGNGYGFDRLVAPTTEEANAGNAICRIVSSAGEELISFTGLTVTGTTCTLTGVTRGIYDTVPLAHPAGAVVWFVSEGVGFTQDTPYVGDGVTSVRLLPFNQREALALASATTISVTRSSRALEPYPPGGPLLNGTYMPAIITGPLTVSWSHRDRVAQGRTPISQQNGSVGPEAGTTYTLRLYDETNTLRRTYTSIAGTSQVWDTEETDCGLLDVAGGTPPTEAAGIRDNCVYFYPLSETTGTTARDFQATSPINATYTSSPTLNQTAIRTGGTPSVLINSGARVVGNARPAELLATGTYSMAGWFRFTAWSSSVNTLCTFTESGETEATNYRLAVYVNASRQLVYAHEYGAGLDEVVTATGMAALSLNTNYLIAVTVDQPTKTVRFYVNGALVDTRTYVNDVTGGAGATMRLVIGNSAAGTGVSGDSLNGRVQDILFTTDVLTASEITWLYNGGSGRSVLDTIGSAPRLNSRVRLELESVRAGLTSYARHSYTVQRAGQQTQIDPLPGTLNFLGTLPGNAVVGTPISVQFQPGGLAGSAVWSIEPTVAGATISGVGLLSFNAPAAGSYTINVRLTDHPSLASVTRTFLVSATTTPALPATNAVIGVLPNGYAGVPYYAIGAASASEPTDGITIQRATVNTLPWYTRSTGLPDGLSLIDAQRADIAGVPQAAGSISATFSGGVLGTGATSLNATATIYPTPAFTVFNPFDRNVGNEVRFVNSTTPLLTARTTGQWNGRARTINGMATADTPRYWEVTVGALGTGALSLGMGVSASSGLVGPGGHRVGVSDGDWGYEIERPFSGADLRAFITGRSFTPYTIGVPVAGTGVTLRFACRQGGTGRRLWIAVENGPWIGGGDPVANTTPTIDNMVIPGGSFWNDYRPALYLNGDCEATANFGSQPWKYAAPTGYAGIAYALPTNGTTENGWDNETEALVAGTTPPPPGRQDRSESRGTLLNWARTVGFGAPNSMTSPSSLLAFAPKTTGKWQFEVFTDSGYAAVSGAGLVPNDWPNQVAAGLDLPVPGATADSLGVRFATGLEPGGSTDGEVRINNAVPGSFTRLQANDVLTFACDFDARTVALYRAGTLVGTYTLPVTGKPWAICAFGGQWGGAVLRTRSLAHPQAGFSNWTITGA